MRVGTRKNTALTMNSMMTANSEDAINESSVEEKEPLNPDKSNFVFGMHPLNPDQIVINPKYPPQFFPYLYPHLYPHLFPKLYPHYTQNYQKIIKDKKRDEKKTKEKDKRTITVVLPDGRHILMNKKEFLAYQLALAQQGYNLSPEDLKKINKDGNLESEPEDDQDSDELIKPTRDVALDVDPQKLQASTTAIGDLPNPSRPSPKPPGNMRSAGAQTQTNGTTNLNLDVPDT